jgi:hypothetical protein
MRQVADHPTRAGEAPKILRETLPRRGLPRPPANFAARERVRSPEGFPRRLSWRHVAGPELAPVQMQEIILEPDDYRRLNPKQPDPPQEVETCRARASTEAWVASFAADQAALSNWTPTGAGPEMSDLPVFLDRRVVEVEAPAVATVVLQTASPALEFLPASIVPALLAPATATRALS